MHFGSSTAGAALKPHQVRVEKQTLGDWQHLPSKVTASVTMIIYADGIAETEDEDNLDKMIALNDQQAKTVELLAGMLKAALSDAYPIPYARGHLESVIAQKDPSLDDEALQTVYGNIVHAPEGKELETLQQESTHYSLEWKGIKARPRLRRAQ